ncbi:PIN domain nuclease [Bosea vestrisii]|uniref:type II toxin-antitoxin system VapC family toxin n=1 Tax=Bosea vestrisii TaxID=151416 RepID=UPI0024DF6517|nr:PIN domain nuclease [Bosea vestrisii]WID98309.1 PIN domain nuclease [Bosea vestrisii]
MIAVDSSVWIALLRRTPSQAVTRLNAIESARSILVGDIVLLEVLRGARDEAHAAAIEKRLRRFQLRPMLSPELASQAARHYRKLRGLGVTIRKSPDLVIATYCIAHGHHLLHQDRDFEPFAQHCGLLIA